MEHNNKKFSLNFIQIFDHHLGKYCAQCAQIPDFEVYEESEEEVRAEIVKRIGLATLDKRNGMVGHYSSLLPEFKTITLSCLFSPEEIIVVNSDNAEDIDNKIKLAGKCKIWGWDAVYDVVTMPCEKLYLESIKDVDYDGEIIRLKSVL